MKFWHLQMNQPWGRKSIYINSRDMLEEEVPIIGTGDWDDNQFYNFINADGNGLNNEDIVLVREGKNPIALCKVISDTFSDDELQKKYKNQNFRKVKVLAFYDDTAKQILNKKLEEFDKSFIQASGTFTKCVNKNATNNFIEDWYNQVIKMGKIKERINILDYKKQIILQGPPGTGKTREAKLIAKEIINKNLIDFQTIHTKKLTKDLIKNSLKVGEKIKGKSNIEFEILKLDKNVVLIKSETSKPWKPSYNKIINSYENRLWEQKGRTGGYKAYEDAIAKYFYDNKSILIKEVEETINKKEDFIKILQFHPSYTYEDFVRGIVAKPNEDAEGILYEAENKILAKLSEDAQNDIENNYVLIIDEINRANLSSVLGELIYALEYRGEEVESMYEVDGSQKLILPPNLYIIGTMNTADRSVGHIDYAIRRRFAFVEVLPEKLKDNDEIFFNTSDFIDVAKLFIKVGEDQVLDFEKAENSDFLSDDFSAKDVALGHSYFIAEKKKISEDNRQEYFNMKMKYEVIPILNEYLKDGVFNEEATVKIKEIEQRFA